MGCYVSCFNLSEQPHILHQHRIHTNAVEAGDKSEGVLQLVIVDNRVDRHMNLRPILMSVAAQLGYVLNAVTRCLTRAEACRANVHGIRTMVYGRNATSQVLCWS